MRSQANPCPLSNPQTRAQALATRKALFRDIERDLRAKDRAKVGKLR